MKILVIGAGMIGTTIAIDLSIDNEVTLFDKNVTVLEHIKNIGYENIDTISGEIYDENLFRPLIMKHDVVVIALPGNMAAYVAKLALYQNKPVFDISSIPNNIILDEIKKIADENHTIYVPKMGIAPGMTNFLTGRGCKDLDEVTDVKIYVGGIPEQKNAPLGYKTVFCLRETLQEYVDDAAIIRDGQKQYVKAMSGLHDVQICGIDGLEAFITDGLATLTETIKSKNMAEYTVRWSGHTDKIKSLVEAGMMSEHIENVNGSNIIPRELLVSHLEPLWKMHPERGDRDLTLFKIVIMGKKDDIQVQSVWETLVKYDEIKNITSMSKCTALVCVTFIRAWQKNLFSADGFVFPESLADNDLLYEYIMNTMASHGIHFEVQYSELKSY